MPLSRSRTINPRRMKRTVSLGAATRKASKAGAKLSRQASLQEKRAVKVVTLSLKETKLFKTAWQAAGYSVSQVAGKAMAACGFVTTSAADPAGGPTLSYGATVIRNLEMARPFHKDNADDNLAQMSLEGRRVIPTSAHNAITISRAAIDTNNVSTANACQPLYVRMIVVTPKGPAGTTMVTDPNTDLFITAWGQETGVMKTGTTAMASQDFMDAVVNPNKYSVLRDEIKIAYQPVANGNQHTGGGAAEDQVKQLSSNPTAVRFHIRHQIAAKKGGQVLYNNPNTAVNAEAGHRREYTLLHFWQPGQINATQFAEVPARLTVRCRPYSAFKEG